MMFHFSALFLCLKSVNPRERVSTEVKKKDTQRFSRWVDENQKQPLGNCPGDFKVRTEGRSAVVA